MRRPFILIALAGLLACMTLPVLAAVKAGNPQLGQPAPPFRLQDQTGRWHANAEYHGHWLVLCFYPNDGTPGSSTEISAINHNLGNFAQAGALVVGVSTDTVKSHAGFAGKYHVRFPLLSDLHNQVANSYGVLMSAVGLHFAKRTTFLIGPDGRIARIYRDVDPAKNPSEVLADLAALKKVHP